MTAVRKAREAGLTGRMYNEFIWVGYILKEWPEERVFIDGQTDFYGEEIARTHSRIASLSPGWRGAVEEVGHRHRIDAQRVGAEPRAGARSGLGPLALRLDGGAPAPARHGPSPLRVHLFARGTPRCAPITYPKVEPKPAGARVDSARSMMV